MEKEYQSRHQMGPYPKVVIYAILGFFPLLGIILTVAAIYVSYISFVFDGYTLLGALLVFAYIMLVACICYIVGWVCISNGLAQYRFAKSGLLVKYPLRSEHLIPWSEFQEICVCHAAIKYGVGGNSIICCVRKGEHKNWWGRWKTDNFFRYKTVMCIDYRPSLLEGLREMCPYPVEDLRDSPEYRLH